MKYITERIVHVRESILVLAADIPGIKQGDTLSTSGSRKGYQVVFDGGIDFRLQHKYARNARTTARAQKQGKCLILHKDRVFQYVIRKIGSFNTSSERHSYARRVEKILS